jgi:hypothetical protein
MYHKVSTLVLSFWRSLWQAIRRCVKTFTIMDQGQLSVQQRHISDPPVAPPETIHDHRDPVPIYSRYPGASHFLCLTGRIITSKLHISAPCRQICATLPYSDKFRAISTLSCHYLPLTSLVVRTPQIGLPCHSSILLNGRLSPCF